MILPKKIDIDKAKSQEKKMQVDEGLILARRVDELRSMRVQMEKNFEVWRVGTSKTIQDDIDGLLAYRDGIYVEIVKAKKDRDELMKPLDEEWARVNKEGEGLIKDKNELFLDTERLKIKEVVLEKEKTKISEAIKKAKQNEKDTEKAKQSATSLNELAQGKYEEASRERDEQSERYESKIKEVNQREKEYEIALQTITVKERGIEEKEAELLERENTLARRIKNLQRVEETK